jgi:hypothetical protein
LYQHRPLFHNAAVIDGLVLVVGIGTKLLNGASYLGANVDDFFRLEWSLRSDDRAQRSAFDHLLDESAFRVFTSSSRANAHRHHKSKTRAEEEQTLHNNLKVKKKKSRKENVVTPV